MLISMIILLATTLPDYLSYEHPGAQGEGGGLNAMLMNFVLRLMLLITVFLLVAFFFLRVKIHSEKGNNSLNN